MPSIISADLKVAGNLVSTGDLQVEGTVEGDIESRTVTIGEAAQVRGSVTAETVRICGSVTGQVKGTSVTLAKTAKVVGDVLHQSLAVEQGAFIDGHCRRTEAASTASAEAKVAMMRDKGSVTPVPEAKPAPVGTAGVFRPALNEASSR